MNYKIMIVTKKYYDIMHNTFKQKYDKQKYHGAKDFGELHLEGLTVYLRRSIEQTRGHRVHIAYADEEILENKELVNMILRPITILNSGNGLFPLTKSALMYVFEVQDNEIQVGN